MTQGRIILVSNRLPVTVSHADGEISLVQSGGGLATGLKGVRGRQGSTWIGWPGEVPSGRGVRAELEKKLAAEGLEPIYLSRAEVRGFYEDYSNAAIWPVFHDMLDQLPLEITGWEMYREVNQRFAEAVAACHREGDLIWVNDYHLMLAPAQIRQLIPNARIGFFLHIPFPASEMFRVLPQRREVLQGLLGADLIGFHTRSYAENFLSSVQTTLAEKVQPWGIRRRGRTARVGVYPMGIDAATWEQRARSTPVAKQVLSLLQDAGNRKIVLGIDRLDYTKGLPRRIAAFERLFQSDPSLAEHVRFIQVTFPSRERIESYAGLRRQLSEMVGRINATYGSPRSLPIHLMLRSFPEEEVSALYGSADIMMVTPLIDGMNLVSKEFIASRLHDDGVLILSEFAGAAAELNEAILINPYDTRGLAEAIRQAIHMPGIEQRERMAKLRAKVKSNTVHAWAETFITELAGETIDGGASDTQFAAS
jgi:trehalose 6-phosphate synthase/phosphatase